MCKLINELKHIKMKVDNEKAKAKRKDEETNYN